MCQGFRATTHFSIAGFPIAVANSWWMVVSPPGTIHETSWGSLPQIVLTMKCLKPSVLIVQSKPPQRINYD